MTAATIPESAVTARRCAKPVEFKRMKQRRLVTLFRPEIEADLPAEPEESARRQVPSQTRNRYRGQKGLSCRVIGPDPCFEKIRQPADSPRRRNPCNSCKITITDGPTIARRLPQKRRHPVLPVRFHDSDLRGTMMSDSARKASVRR